MGIAELKHYDVVVVGGGAAGIAAAVGATQAGASVCLVEQYGFLGGAATNSSVLTHCGFFDQTKTQVVKGVGQQVLDRLAARGLYQTQTVRETGNTIVLLDQETTKAVYDDLVSAAGIDVLLHAVLVGAATDGGRVTSVDVAHRGGRVALSGAAFVDCSGDGALLELAGAAYQLSAPAERQAATLVMHVGGVAEDATLAPADMDEAVRRFEQERDLRLGRTSGIAVRMPVTREVMMLLVDQHRDVLDVHELTRAETEARRLSWHYLEAFRKGLAGWQDAYLASTGPQIGIREGRRLQGRDVVTSEDVSTARKRPEDGVARCGWPMENHVAPGVTEYGGIAGRGWYDIPYGALCSASTDNLWAAGRLASSDPRAYASLRVMGTAFATGHAAGVGAAVYAEGGAHDLRRLREVLLGQGALL
jgi:hypothetical protein